MNESEQKLQEYVKSSGNLPYGYRKDEHNAIVIDEEKAKVVNLIYDAYLNGLNTNNIIEMLAQKEIISPQGKLRWTGMAVNYILSNEKYTGLSVKERIVYQKGWQMPQHYRQKVIYESPGYAIISKKVFCAVQAERFKRERAKQKQKQKKSKQWTR